MRNLAPKSLLSISDCCNENGLKLSILKTDPETITGMKKWKLFRSLKVNDNYIGIKSSAFFLGVTLESKLQWSEISKKNEKS